MDKKEKYILMHQNDEVLSFTVTFGERNSIEVIEKLKHFDKAPYGVKDDMSKEEIRSRIQQFFNTRCIAATRFDYEQILKYTGCENPFKLSFKGHGLSLSNHYWFKKEDENLRYEDINFFTNGWDDTFGRAVLSGNYEALKDADLNVPDIVIDGWCAKGWLYEDGVPRLYKLGINKDHYEEPIAEVLASRLAKRLFKDDESLTYELKEIYGKYASVSKAMIGLDEELVPLSVALPNDLENLYRDMSQDRRLYKQFFQRLSECGMPELSKFFMKIYCWRSLCFANDLHFNNLGLIRNIKTGKLRIAPLYDFGGSFGSSERGRKLLSNVNKATYLIVYFAFNDLQEDWDYSWYDPKSLEGFEDDIKELLSKSDFYSEELINNIIDVYRRQKDNLDEMAKTEK